MSETVVGTDAKKIFITFCCVLRRSSHTELLYILLPLSAFILSSYLVIPKGKAADGEERESRLEAGALSSLFRRITGLRRDQHLIFWF